VPTLRGRVAQLRRREPPLTSNLTCAPAHQDAAVLRFCVGASQGALYQMPNGKCGLSLHILRQQLGVACSCGTSIFFILPRQEVCHQTSRHDYGSACPRSRQRTQHGAGSAAEGSLELRVTAPLVLHNALPMPVHAIAYGLSSWMNIRCAAFALTTLVIANRGVLT